MDESNDRGFVGGFVPIVRAEGDVTVREAGAMAIVAGGDATINEAGAGLCVVGGDLTLNQGGAGNMIIGGNAELSEAAVGQMVTAEASVSDSRVGILLAGSANLERSEILLSTQQAVGLGAALGVVFFLLSRLFGRK